MKKSFLASLLSLLIFFALGAVLVYAQGTVPTTPDGSVEGPGLETTLPNPFGSVNNSLFGILETIIREILVPVGGILAVLAFIYTGFQYVTAQGDAKKIGDAHKALLYTSIGTALLLGAWLFASVICNTVHQLGGPLCPTL